MFVDGKEVLQSRQSLKTAAVMQVGPSQLQSLGWDDPPEKETATHFSILAWEIPWTEELGAQGSPWTPPQSPGSSSLLGSSGKEAAHCHPRASSAKTRGFHTQLDEGPETP